MRLQRTPTHIHIDAVSETVRINSGMTCTVVVESPAREWAIPSPIRRGFARWRQPTERKAKVQAMREDSMQRLPWPHHSQSKGNEDSRLPRAPSHLLSEHTASSPGQTVQKARTRPLRSIEPDATSPLSQETASR